MTQRELSFASGFGVVFTIFLKCSHLFFSFFEGLDGFRPQQRILREKLVIRLAGKVWKASIWSKNNNKKTVSKQFSLIRSGGYLRLLLLLRLPKT